MTRVTSRHREYQVGKNNPLILMKFNPFTQG